MDFLVYLLFTFLEKILPLFPLSFTRKIAKLNGIFFYYFIPIRKKTAFSNLKLAFPEKNDTELKKIIKDCYVNIMIVITEFFYLPKLKLNEFKDIFNFTNPEIIKEKLKAGKGLILISAHFGNWELAAYVVSRICGEPFNVIVKEQSNKLVDKKINTIRESGGNIMLDMRSSPREVLTLLKANKTVAMLSDQSAPKENTKIDFFIKDVPVFEGAARFAIKTGAEVLFGVPVREDDYSYSFTFREIDIEKYRNYIESNVKALTQEHADLLIEKIKEHPDHWLWFHRRFKNAGR